MPSINTLLSLLSLFLLSLFHAHTAFALSTDDISEYTKRDDVSFSFSIICPSPKAPRFGPTSGAWKVIKELKGLEYGPAPQTVLVRETVGRGDEGGKEGDGGKGEGDNGVNKGDDGCRRMGCQEGLGVWWCVGDVTWTTHNMPTYKSLADQAQMVLDEKKCKTADVTNTRPLVAGEAKMGDKWSVVLRGMDCDAE